MSFAQLLTAGKSLMGLQNSPTRYAMRKKNLLPKFGSGENPFLGRAETKPSREPAKAPSIQEPPWKPAPSAPAQIAPLPERAKEARQETFMSLKSEPAQTAKPVTAAKPVTLREANPVQQWFQRLNPLGRSRKSAAKSAVPKFHRAPVQGELSLDNIKVVRNDLSEADVEVVPARSAAKPAPARPGADVTAAPAPTVRENLVPQLARNK